MKFIQLSIIVIVMTCILAKSLNRPPKNKISKIYVQPQEKKIVKGKDFDKIAPIFNNPQLKSFFSSLDAIKNYQTRWKTLDSVKSGFQLLEK